MSETLVNRQDYETNLLRFKLSLLSLCQWDYQPVKWSRCPQVTQNLLESFISSGHDKMSDNKSIRRMSKDFTLLATSCPLTTGNSKLTDYQHEQGPIWVFNFSCYHETKILEANLVCHIFSH